MTNGTSNGAPAIFDPFLKIKKGSPFARDRLAPLVRAPYFDKDSIKIALQQDLKIVPSFGRFVRIHLNRNEANKPEVGSITFTGAQGNLLNIQLHDDVRREIFRLFPFPGYSKLEAFLSKDYTRISIYDLLLRDGQALDRLVRKREAYLPLTNIDSKVCCLRSYQSLDQVFNAFNVLDDLEDWNGFLVRSGCNNEPGVRWTFARD